MCGGIAVPLYLMRGNWGNIERAFGPCRLRKDSEVPIILLFALDIYGPHQAQLRASNLEVCWARARYLLIASSGPVRVGRKGTWT